jgi:hypothetical protein
MDLNMGRLGLDHAALGQSARTRLGASRLQLPSAVQAKIGMSRALIRQFLNAQHPWPALLADVVQQSLQGGIIRPLARAGPQRANFMHGAEIGADQRQGLHISIWVSL